MSQNRLQKKLNQADVIEKGRRKSLALGSNIKSNSRELLRSGLEDDKGWEGIGHSGWTGLIV
jgi:hypothetical protein